MRLHVVPLLMLAAAQAMQVQAAEDPRMRKVESTAEYRRPTALRVLGPHLVLSRESNDSAEWTDRDVIQLDVTDAKEKRLVESERGAEFVAADAKYLVYARSGAHAWRLIAREHSTGEQRGTIRFYEGASWARIQGQRLLVLQDREAVFLTVPDLKVERTQPLESLAAETQVWNDRIVILTRRSLRLYDSELSGFTELPLPTRQPGERQDCVPGSLRIYQNLAIVSSQCEQISVFDLARKKLERVIDGFATTHTLAVIDGLLFAAPTSQFAQQKSIRVYELATGRELARLATEAQFMAAHSGKLLVLHQEKYAGPGHFTVYEPDVGALRSDQAHQERLLTGCRRDGADDLHEYINTCEAAGVRGFLEASPLPPRLSAVVGNYADALAQTLSRYDEAIPVLERLESTPQRDAALKLARRKASFLSSGRSPAAAAMPGLLNVPIDFGSLDNLIAFASDQAYVARWRCDENEAEGFTVDVLDRRTYAKRKRLSIAPCEASYRDATSSITALPGALLLELGQNAVAVMDPRSHEIVARGRAAISPMRMGEWEGRLLYCGKGENELHARLDTSTARLVAASEDESRACESGDARRKYAAYYPTPGSTELLASTRGFRIYGGTEPSYVRHVMRFAPTGEGETFTRTTDYSPWNVLAVSGQDALIYSIGVSFFHYDIPARRERLLFELKQGAPIQDSALWRQYLFVAVGRDLIVYDFARRSMAHYERDLVAAGCAPCGRDDRIFRLVLDEDRLIVLTRPGEPSRVIDLPVLAASLGTGDFFASRAEP